MGLIEASMKELAPEGKHTFGEKRTCTWMLPTPPRFAWEEMSTHVQTEKMNTLVTQDVGLED